MALNNKNKIFATFLTADLLCPPRVALPEPAPLRLPHEDEIPEWQVNVSPPWQMTIQNQSPNLQLPPLQIENDWTGFLEYLDLLLSDEFQMQELQNNIEVFENLQLPLSEEFQIENNLTGIFENANGSDHDPLQ